MVLHNVFEHLQYCYGAVLKATLVDPEDGYTWSQGTRCLSCIYAATLCPAALFALSTMGLTGSSGVRVWLCTACKEVQPTLGK